MTLSPEDQSRIAAEEAYRAQLRAQEASRKRYGCAAWGCGGVALLAIGMMSLAAVGRSAGSGSGVSSDPRIEFVVNCKEELRAQLKAPATAKISNAFSDGISGGGSSYAWSGTVDAQNGFGANIRSSFRCQGSPYSPTVILY